MAPDDHSEGGGDGGGASPMSTTAPVMSVRLSNIGELAGCLYPQMVVDGDCSVAISELQPAVLEVTDNSPDARTVAKFFRGEKVNATTAQRILKAVDTVSGERLTDLRPSMLDMDPKAFKASLSKMLEKPAELVLAPPAEQSPSGATGGLVSLEAEVRGLRGVPDSLVAKYIGDYAVYAPAGTAGGVRRSKLTLSRDDGGPVRATLTTDDVGEMHGVALFNRSFLTIILQRIDSEVFVSTSQLTLQLPPQEMKIMSGILLTERFFSPVASRVLVERWNKGASIGVLAETVPEVARFEQALRTAKGEPAVLTADMQILHAQIKS